MSYIPDYTLIAVTPASHSQYISLTLQKDGTQWYVIARNNSSSERTSSASIHFVFGKTSSVIKEEE